MKLIIKVNTVLEKIEETILIGAMAALSIILIVNVISRKAGYGIFFLDEIAIILIIWVSFVGLSYAARKGEHICMAAIFDMSPLRVKKILIFIISAISAIVMFYLAYLSVKYVFRIYHFQEVTVAMRVPYWIVIIIAPFGFFLAGLHYIRTIIKNIKEQEDVWMSPERKSEYDEI